eukprot:7519774-Alexandrium_andersonii.AAC.1
MFNIAGLGRLLRQSARRRGWWVLRTGAGADDCSKEVLRTRGLRTEPPQLCCIRPHTTAEIEQSIRESRCTNARVTFEPPQPAADCTKGVCNAA